MNGAVELLPNDRNAVGIRNVAVDIVDPVFACLLACLLI